MIREGLRVRRSHKKCRERAPFPPSLGSSWSLELGEEGGACLAYTWTLGLDSSCWYLAGRRDTEGQLDKSGTRRTAQFQSYLSGGWTAI